MVWIVNWAQPSSTQRQFISNICQNGKTGKTSPLRWSLFKTNYRAESWVTATGALEHESKFFTQNNCVTPHVCACVCLCVRAFQYFNRGSSVTAVCNCRFNSLACHACPSIRCIDRQAASWEQHGELFTCFTFLHIHSWIMRLISFWSSTEAIDCMGVCWREQGAFVRACVLG